MRLLITGGSGYIGTRFMAAMAARPEVEEIVDLDIRGPEAPHDKVRFVERSVTEDLRDLFTDAERPIEVLHGNGPASRGVVDQSPTQQRDSPA